jgi:AsmA-like C-terminal region
MNRTRKLILWPLAAAALLIVVVLGLLLSAPLWVNQDAVKRQVTEAIAKATGGKAQFDRFELHFFPRPGANVTHLRFSLPGKVEAQAEAAAVEVELLPLIMGRVSPHSVRLSAPQVSVRVDEPTPSQQSSAQQDTLADLRKTIDQILGAAPHLLASVTDGRVELVIGQRPPLLLQKIQARIETTPDRIEGKLSCAANLWDGLSVELRVARGDLAGDGHLELAGLQVARLGAPLGLAASWPVEEATADAKLAWQVRSRTLMKAEASLSAPRVSVQLGQGGLDLVAPALTMAAQLKDGSLEVTLERLRLDAPHLALSGKLVRSQAGVYTLEAKGSDVDLAALQATGLKAAPQVEFFARPPVSFEQGTATALTLSGQGDTLEALVQPERLQANALLDNVQLRIPDIDLLLHDVRGSAALERGVLKFEQVQARLGKSVARDGVVIVKLDTSPTPLHIEATVDADLAEAYALIKRLVKNREVQHELDRVHDLQGTALGRLTLGETVDDIVPRVDVQAINASGRHAGVPLPIRITGGRLGYMDEAFSAQELEGQVGESSFSGVNAHLGLKSPATLNLEQGSALLALEELFRWLSSEPSLAEQLKDVQAISGRLAVSTMRVEGQPSSPENLQFQVSAHPRRVVIDAPEYAPRTELDGGAIEISPQRIAANGVQASVLDASLKVSGQTQDYRKGIGNIKATASGTMGLEALAWIYTRTGLPRQLRLRAGLAVSEVGLDWSKGEGVALRAKASVADGPFVSLALRNTQNVLEIQDITVRDDASDASFGGVLSGEQINVRFKGRLAGTSIGRILLEPPLSAGELQGDFSAETDLDDPSKSRASGHLQGAMIVLPETPPVPLTIENFSVDGKETRLMVNSATLSSGDSRVEVNGQVAYLNDKFSIEGNVRGDTVVVPVERVEPDAASAPPLGDAKKFRMHQLWQSPVSGHIGVNIAHLRVGRTEIAPLIAEVALKENRFDLRLKHAALCAINMTGGLTAQPGNIDLEVTLKSRAAPLHQTITCLTDKTVEVTGTVDLDAGISVHGKGSTLMDQMQGTFSATARDGRIEKAPILAKVFEVLNLTEAVHGKLPDLGKKGMGYESARATGRIEGRRMRFDEVVLNATGVMVAAKGTINYTTGLIDGNFLVAPLKTVDYVVNHIPIVRNILGGTLLALPVHVGGTLRSPVIAPLGPRAVASRVIDIIANTLRLPADLFASSQPPAGTPTTGAPGK